jgi:hypothetical protein
MLENIQRVDMYNSVGVECLLCTEFVEHHGIALCVRIARGENRIYILGKLSSLANRRRTVQSHKRPRKEEVACNE